MIRFKISGDNQPLLNTICKKLKENCVCCFDDTTYNIEINIHNSDFGPSFDIIGNKVSVFTVKDYNSEDFVRTIVSSIFRKFNIESLDFDLTVKDADTIENSEINLGANYDKKANILSRGIDDPVISLDTAKRAKSSLIYVVRRNFMDIDSERFQGESLTKAIMECDKHACFKVFDDTGKVIYSSKKNKTVISDNSNLDKKLDEKAAIRTGNGIRINGIHIPDGTIVNITKRSNIKSEIMIHLGKEMIKTEVFNNILSRV